MLMWRPYDTKICSVFLAELIVYFCAIELAVAPLNKGGKEIILEKQIRFLKTDWVRNNNFVWE